MRAPGLVESQATVAQFPPSLGFHLRACEATMAYFALSFSPLVS